MPTRRRLRKWEEQAIEGVDNLYAAAYADKFDTLEQLRTAMIRHGIVEHRINAIDALQRAIDDTTIDYLALRNFIDQVTNANQLDPHEVVDHPAYQLMEHLRDCMVRYSTFAIQYDLQRRQQQISEARIALLANALREILMSPDIGLNSYQIREIPRQLVNTLNKQLGYDPQDPLLSARDGAVDPDKAEALAEIIRWDTKVDIIDLDDKDVQDLQEIEQEAKTQAENALKNGQKRDKNGRKLKSGRRIKPKRADSDGEMAA